MPIDQDIENASEPLIKHRDRDIQSNKVEGKGHSNKDGSVSVVLFSTVVAVCGSFEFGSCVGYSGPAQSGIRKDLGLSLSEYSVFGSILNIGAMIGAITSGRIADFMGRKGAMRLAAAFCVLGWTAVYLSQGALLLDHGRFCMGYGIGILSYVVPVFIAEIAPKNLRGGLTTLNQLMICSGASLAFVVGTMVTWRTLALTGIVPCIVLLAGLFFIPESPRWLAKVGRQKDFMAALQYLRGEGADISNEAAEIQDFVDTLAELQQAKTLDLFQKQYARSVVVGVGLMVFQQFGGINGLAFYVSETFVSAGFNSGSLGTILWACIQIPITAFGAILMDKTGRTALLKISATGTGIGCILTGLSFCLKGYAPLQGWGPIFALTGILMYIGSFSIGMGAVPWVVMSEIFPMNIKGIAGSLVTLVNWAGAWIVSYTFNFLMTWSSPGTLLLYAAVSVATVLFVVKLVPETKGRTLEEIQSTMNS